MLSSRRSVITYIQVHFRLEFFMEANSMNSDQQSDLGPYCLQYGKGVKIEK